MDKNSGIPIEEVGMDTDDLIDREAQQVREALRRKGWNSELAPELQALINRVSLRVEETEQPNNDPKT